MIDNGLRTPDGFKDSLPADYVARKRTEERVFSVFRAYGYLPLGTPALEFAEVFSDKGSVEPSQMYRLLDRDGNLLAMRSDVTPPVARVVATNYADSDMPLRFCYAQNVYRCCPQYQGRAREIAQAGIELIGAPGDDADAEALAVAIDALLSAGLDDFRIDVGQVCFLSGVLEESGLGEDVRLAIHDHVARRDFVSAERAGRDNDVPPNVALLLSELPFFCGGPDMLRDALAETVGDKSRAALVNLMNIHSALSDYGFAKYVTFDLSMSGDMDYYTGIIFRGYTSGMGFSILGGGRYDGLMARFGDPRPSVGLMIKVDNVTRALENKNGREENPVPDVMVVWDEKSRARALARARELRRGGRRVVTALAAMDLETCAALFERTSARQILYLNGDGESLFERPERKAGKR